MSVRLAIVSFCVALSCSYGCLIGDVASADETTAAASPEAAISNDSQTEPPGEQTRSSDPMREIQSKAIIEQTAAWGRWGHLADRYSTWTNHSNRLIPIYTFGITLDALRDEGSAYASEQRLKELYGRVPDATQYSGATYFDQTDVYRLQKAAVAAGKTNLITIVFDGMDWQTTLAAAVYRSGKVGYDSGRGTGLSFQDYLKAPTDFGLFCCSPRSGGAKFDVDSQVVTSAQQDATGGYNAKLGGIFPWHEQSRIDYLLGTDRSLPHTVTDSASSATSLFAGIKTYNGAINVDVDGNQVKPIGRELQEQGFRIGVVSSVPVSHATPAAVYANNVSRSDYQDITRDLLGLPSAAHRSEPLSGVDVLIGCGWGVEAEKDASQGANFAQGNKYLHQSDLESVNLESGGKYLVAQRQRGKLGGETLRIAAAKAAAGNHRLLGFYGVTGGHLPYQTADGGYDPTFDIAGTERYSEADVSENPTLAEMAEAALSVLEKSSNGFFLMIEAGDVDWANHANNLDNSIGAVLSGDAAFDRVTKWIDRNDAWSKTALIVTADHGHFMVIEDASVIANAGDAGK